MNRALGWDVSGWPDFAMYYPIFVAAAEAPAVFGGALDREVVRRAVKDGAASVLGDAAQMFGLDQALDDAEQVMREAGQQVAHCDALPDPHAARHGRGAAAARCRLARAVIAAWAETGGPVVVITGNGHARTDWGVPQALRRAAPELKVLSLGQFEAARPRADAPYDLVAADRADDRARIPAGRSCRR